MYGNYHSEMNAYFAENKDGENMDAEKSHGLDEYVNLIFNICN